MPRKRTWQDELEDEQRLAILEQDRTLAAARMKDIGVISGGTPAPNDADYLVGTANADLSAEIVVGTTPGGELGGTWPSPTVDATHSGSAHHAAVTIGADGQHSLATQVLSGVAATAAQAGHATTAQITKLDGIATGADVTADNAPKAHGPSKHTEGTAWRMTYYNAAGDETEIALGADNTVLTSTGAAGAPAFEAGGGGSDNDLTAIPASDHTASGLTVTLTAGTSVEFGVPCYIRNDSKMTKCLCDVEATSRCVALAIATIAQDASGSFLLHGFARDDDWNWTPGNFVYVSTGLPALSQTAPTGTDDAITIVGVALTADVLYFNPQLVVVEHT